MADARDGGDTVARRMWLAVLAALLLLILSGGAATDDPGAGWERTIRYSVYIGLNDKDTYVQEIPTGQAEKIVTDIALKYADGFTWQEAGGVYRDGTGTVTREKSLVYVFLGATQAQVEAIAADVAKALNQDSVLIERESVDYVYYKGEEAP